MRFEDCEKYSHCLGIAARRNQKELGCAGCDCYQAMPRGKGVYLSSISSWTEPATPETKGSISALSSLLSKRMRALGIPTGDFRETSNEETILRRSLEARNV